MIVDNCLSILGSSTYLEGNRYNKMANDLKGFNWWEGTDEMLAFHITVSCIAHGATDLKVNNLEQIYYRKEHGTWERSN